MANTRSELKGTKHREAGRELDAEVAEKVLGWTEVHQDEWTHEWLGHYPNWPHPQIIMATPPQCSTDWSAVRQVIDHFDTNFRLTRHHLAPWGSQFIYDAQFDFAIGSGDTVELAICLAALSRVEHSN